MNRQIIVLVIGIISLSCSDENPADDGFCDRYEEAKLLVGLSEGADLENYFNTVNDSELSIDQVSGNYYVSGLPADSIDYVIEYLNSKSYINSHGFTAVKNGSVYLNFQTQALTVACNMWDMTPEAQRDWIETIDLLKLSDRSSTRSFVLTVPIGEEKKWATTFKSFDDVRYAELNCYVDIVPLDS